MSLLIMFLFIIAAYGVMRFYATQDRRLPPASTRKGKEARIVLGIILVALVAELIFQMFTSDMSAVFWIAMLSFTGGMSILRYVRFKDSDK